MKKMLVFIFTFLLALSGYTFATMYQIGAFKKTKLSYLEEYVKKLVDLGYIVKVYERGDLKKVIVETSDEKVEELKKLIPSAFMVKEEMLEKEGFKLIKEWKKNATEKEQIKQPENKKKRVESKNEKLTTVSKRKAPQKPSKKKVLVFNSLEKVLIKDGFIYLFGRSPWEYADIEEFTNPYRIVLHLYNAKNNSGVTELLFPLSTIDKLRIVYDPKKKETMVMLYPAVKVSVKLTQTGRMLRLNPIPIVETKRGKMGEKGKFEVYKGQRISLEFKDADIRDVIRILAEVSGMNFVIDPKVKGTVTIRLINVSWEKALDVILKTYKLGKIEEDGIIRIGPLKDIEEEMKQRAKAIKAREETEPLITEIFPLNYADISEAAKLVKPLLSKRGKVDKINRLNAIMVKDIRDRIEKIRKLLKSIDTPIPQVQISARLVEVATDFTRELGIQWGFLWHQSATSMSFPYSFGIGGGVSSSPAASQSLNTMSTAAGWSPADLVKGFVVDLPAAVTTGAGGAIAASLLNRSQTFGIDMRLSAMENEGLAKIVSTPKVITMDNQEAEISQGYEIPYSTVSEQGTQTEFKEATLKLKVRPHITAEGDIILDVEVSKDSPDFTHVTPDGVPIQTRTVKTSVRMKNGDTLVIGGIYEMTKSESTNGVPGLKKIPLLKWLFQTKRKNIQKRELLIFITPTILESSNKIQ